MEDKKRLSQWLLDNYKELELKATQVKWVREWLPGFSDFEVSITISGKVHRGRGIDRNQNLAFTKAGAEALERAICNENKILSCGVATHTDLESAKLNAKTELIERDRFFCHYLTQTPFKKITTNVSGIDLSSLREKLKIHDVTIKIFEMKPLNGIKSAACLSHGKKTGVVLGLGASENKETAIKKSLIECLTNTIASLSGKLSPLDSSEYKGKYKKALSVANNHLQSIYFGSGEESKWGPGTESRRSHGVCGKETDESIREESCGLVSSDSFTYQILETKNSLLKQCPLVTVKCENPFLQKSFYGDFDPKIINLSQMQRFSEKIKKFLTLNHFQVH